MMNDRDGWNKTRTTFRGFFYAFLKESPYIKTLICDNTCPSLNSGFTTAYAYAIICRLNIDKYTFSIFK